MSMNSTLRMSKAILVLIAFVFALSSCPNPSTPITYSRIIIDTYNPDDVGLHVDTFITLFDASGDPTTDTSPNLWNDNTSPYTVDAPPVSIDEDNDGNPFFPTFSRIDYTGGLVSGTYYIRVRGLTSGQAGDYAIRVVTYIDPTITKIAQYPDAEGWFFPGPNNPDSYETPTPDDNPQSGGVPTNPVSIGIGDKLNRYLTVDDVDWFKLELP